MLRNDVDTVSEAKRKRETPFPSVTKFLLAVTERVCVFRKGGPFDIWRLCLTFIVITITEDVD